jgi:uroporphyrinogen-III synthase
MQIQNTTNENRAESRYFEFPLAEKKVLVTRPGMSGKAFAQKLAALGAKPIILPFIEIIDPDSWQELDSAINNLSLYQWIFFASANAVNSFMKRLGQNSKAKNLKEEQKLPKIGVLGNSTANALTEFDIAANYCPVSFSAEDFVQEFPDYPHNLTDIRILWPRTNIGSDLIKEKFSVAGAKIDTVTAYKTVLPKNIAQLQKQFILLIENKEIDVLTIANKQTAINIAELLRKEIIRRNLALSNLAEKDLLAHIRRFFDDILIVTIGPESAQGALNYLGKANIEANPHTVDGMIEALVAYYQ